MFLKTIICSMLLYACSDNLETIVEEFYTQAAKRNCYPKRLPIAMSHLMDPYVGLCIPQVTMLIDEDSFRSFGYLQKREVVWHELGHCVLHREHVDDPGSLMFPSMHTELALRENFDKMTDELFADCPYRGE